MMLDKSRPLSADAEKRILAIGLWEKIEDWLYANNLLPFRWVAYYNHSDWLHPSRTIRKLLNVIRWLPVIWEDTDWDYTYLYKMLYIKIQHIVECETSGKIHEDWENNAATMRVAEDCLARLIKDDYASTPWIIHYAKFPNQDRGSWIELPDGMRQMPPLRLGEHESLNAAFEQEELERVADLSLFAKTFVDHVREWWS